MGKGVEGFHVGLSSAGQRWHPVQHSVLSRVGIQKGGRVESRPQGNDGILYIVLISRVQHIV